MEASQNKMSRYPWFLLLTRLLVEGTTPAFGQNTSTDFFRYIDPLIGTTNGGHVFPGATLPFGMAKAVPDVNSDERQGGYASDDGESKNSTCFAFLDIRAEELSLLQFLGSRTCTIAAQAE